MIGTVRHVFFAILLAVAAIFAAGLPPASAQTSFAGKSISVIIGTDAGGGFDLYARVVGRHIARHLPGAPTIVPQNMPGAGSLKAAEYIYSVAPKDGTAFGIIFPGAIMEHLLGDRTRFRYDPIRFEYLGSADSGVRLCVTHRTSKITTFEDALAQPSTFGGNAPGGATTDYAQLLNNLAGTKMKIVNGYKSSLDITLAMERAEVDGICGYDSNSFRAQKPDWFNSPQAHMIVQTSLEPGEALTKMGVPSIWKYIGGENRKIAELIFAQQEFHRPFVAPPGVPGPQLDALRTAFMATLRDPAFLADAQRSNLDINPKDGATVGTLVKQMYAAPAETIERMRKAIRP